MNMDVEYQNNNWQPHDLLIKELAILQESFAVSDVGLHEDYDSWNINNDICMLTLEGSIRSEKHLVLLL